MKKLTGFLFCILLTSCFGSGNTQEIQNAKDDLLHPSNSSINTVQEQKTVDVSQATPNEDMLVNISPLGETQLIQIDRLPEDKINSEEIVISGITLSPNVEKIEVSFSNKQSSFSPDTYTLKSFKPGDTSFRYIASSRQKVLDYGTNEYVFTAYEAGASSKVVVSILLENMTSQNTSTQAVSEIEGLSIENRSLNPMNCDSSDVITQYLTQKYSWVYWNTCRDIIKDKGISYYVLRLSGEEYFYEKQYYDFTTGAYGVLTLETGTGVTSQNISEKNIQLKAQEFPKTLEADSYFRAKINSFSQ